MSREAVALQYGESGAPRVTAKGQGALAERILALAIEAGVPIQKDADLTGLLSACELDREIPEELYVAVAELLVFLRGLEQSLGTAPE
jgi:flagellar biosynthesis protein